MIDHFADHGAQGDAEGPRALVLGANGRLGRLLARAWASGAEPPGGPRLRVIRQMRQRPSGPRSFAGEGPGADAPLLFDPLAEPGALAAAVAGADVVLSLAGPTHPDADHTAHAALARAVLAARDAGARAVPVLLMSSAAIYGRAGGSLDERAPGAPETAYGRGKLAMERVAAAAGGPVHVLRLGNVAGADALLGGARPGRPVVLDRFADGTTPLRAYVGPASLARILAALLARASEDGGLPAVLNVATGQVEMRALLEAAGLPWTPRPAPADAIAEVRLATARLDALVPSPPEARTAAGMVAEWRRLAGAGS